MDKIKISVTKVEQPIGTMYITKMQGNKLFYLANADIRKLYNNEDYIGIQRPLDSERVKNIEKYINTSDASFPNSIILNLKSRYVIEENDDNIIIEKTKSAFSIIDGQHRLAGFENYREDFEVIITFFIDLEDEQQAMLFKTINSEQRKVNPSFKYDLESYSTVKTPEKVIRELTLAFNIDIDSPWYGKIKMNGRKDELSKQGIISQKAFADPIIKYIYNEQDKYILRDKLKMIKKEYNLEDNYNIAGYLDGFDCDESKYILWFFYINDKEELLYKILLNYFNAIREILINDWEYNYSSILIKTTGYNALMKLFYDVFKKLYSEKNFKKEAFLEILSPMSRLEGKITAYEYGASGESASNRLYNEFKALINENL